MVFDGEKPLTVEDHGWIGRCEIIGHLVFIV